MSQLSGSSMTWISRQLSEGRGIGAFDNYGDMLYTEGLQELEKREQQVMYSAIPQSYSDCGMHTMNHGAIVDRCCFA